MSARIKSARGVSVKDEDRWGGDSLLTKSFQQTLHGSQVGTVSHGQTKTLHVERLLHKVGDDPARGVERAATPAC